MSTTILKSLAGREVRRIEPGELVIREGERTDRLYFLIEGSVEVLKDGVKIANVSQPGAVFGEMAVLLGCEHAATVRCVRPSAFHIVENPREFLMASPTMCLHVSEVLARRLESLNQYLVDVKQQFEGHDHLGMVDGLLEALLHRQPRERVRPRESTIRDGELLD